MRPNHLVAKTTAIKTAGTMEPLNIEDVKKEEKHRVSFLFFAVLT